MRIYVEQYAPTDHLTGRNQRLFIEAFERSCGRDGRAAYARLIREYYRLCEEQGVIEGRATLPRPERYLEDYDGHGAGLKACLRLVIER